MEHGYTLPVGARIDNYEIRGILGEGGFGITYKAWDHELGCDVAIKEYLPSDLALRDRDGSTVRPKSDNTKNDYEYGLDMFVNEAKTLATFNEQNIVQVKRFIRVNGTAYLVMNYVEGQSLSQYLKQYEKLEEKTVKEIFLPLLNGLSVVHASNVLHRDIKPGNIYLRKDGVPVLIDFGAAREALGSHSRSMTAIVTPGYAPFEQYSSRSKPGPAMDLYAIGAAMYRCISGQTPVEAPDRVDALYAGEEDPMESACDLGKGRYSQEFLEAIDWMMQPSAKDRPQTVGELLRHPGMHGGYQAAPGFAQGVEATEIIRNDTADQSLKIKTGAGKRLVPAVMLLLLMAGGLGWWIFAPATGGGAVGEPSGAALDRQKAEESEILRKAAEVERNRLAREKKRLEERLAAQKKQSELEKQRFIDAQKKAQLEAAKKRQLELAAERKKLLDERRRAELVRAEAERKRRQELDAERKRLQEERRKAELARAEAEAEKKRQKALEAERQRLRNERSKARRVQVESEDKRKLRLEKERKLREQEKKAVERRKAEERRLAIEREKQRLEKERLALEKKRLEIERKRLEAARKRAATPQVPNRKVVFAVWYDNSNSRRNKLSLPEYSLKVFSHLVLAFKKYAPVKNIVRESYRAAYDMNYEGLSAAVSKKMCQKHRVDMVVGAYYDRGDAAGGGDGREITYIFYNCKTAKRYEDTYALERAEGVAGEKFARSRDLMRTFTAFLKLNIQ